MSVSEILTRRASGVLIHATSLPGPGGVGDLGVARSFCDRLVDAQQTWWQMLPTGPTGVGNSPYHALSAFAGNPLLISLEDLVEDGLLTLDEIPTLEAKRADRVDFGAVIPRKNKALEAAFARFSTSGATELVRGHAAFRDAHEDAWLADYALFVSIREDNGHRPLWEWPDELRRRESSALADARHRLADRIAYHRFTQFLFDRQWQRFREHAAEAGLLLLGDIPIFVSPDSTDVWAHPEIFQIDDEGRLAQLAGVPPDYFSEDGQLWGNPLYDWDVLAESDYAWWVDRFRGVLRNFDAARVDHFIGFYRAWHIPPDSDTARVGEFKPGPRDAFFEALDRQLGQLPIVAEDLGLLTDGVRAMRDKFELPGLKVLQFAFEADGRETENQPHTYPESCVAYTATHDNNTTLGWWNELKATAEAEGDDSEAAGVMRAVLGYLHTDSDDDLHWKLIRLAMSSVANMAITPMQDLLGLDATDRMNTPGVAEDNWEWRLTAEQLESDALARLREITDETGRSPAA